MATPPPTWDDARISGACACMALPTPSMHQHRGAHSAAVTDRTRRRRPGRLLRRERAQRCLGRAVHHRRVRHRHRNEQGRDDDHLLHVTSVETVLLAATPIAAHGLIYKRYTHSFVLGIPVVAAEPQLHVAEGLLSSSTSSSGVTTALSLGGGGAVFDASQAALLAWGFFVAPRAGVMRVLGARWPGRRLGLPVARRGRVPRLDRRQRGAPGLRACGVREAAGGSGSVAAYPGAGDALPLAWLWGNGGGTGSSALAHRMLSGIVTTDLAPFFCNEQEVYLYMRPAIGVADARSGVESSPMRNYVHQIHIMRL
ncbi:hypothetical protein DL767_003579 [Monosporascus sp. MG133]|nr:hypothetical protein DL767_003579 [Monosporascus sp. MG133]